MIASGLHRPNGLAFHKGALYVAELSKVWRYDAIEDHLDSPPKPTLVNDNFPKDEPHGWKFIAIGPDDKLYVPVGAPGNINNPDPKTYAHIRRMNLDGSGMEMVVQGVRNTVGFDWHPTTKELWFTDNGRDWVSEDMPEDELNRVTASGKKHFGYPFCHQGNFARPGDRLGPFLRRVRAAGRAARAPHRRARHALLHGRHVPGRVQERDLHRPARRPGTAPRRSAATSWSRSSTRTAA